MSDVAKLVAAALAAHGQHRIAANANQRQQAAIAARLALGALLGALALNPTRSDPAWLQGTVRTRAQLSDRMVGYYTRYIARADAQGY